MNYEIPCKFPRKCRQQRQENKDCPIKEILGEHLCGDRKKIPERDFNSMNRRRESDQRLDKVGIIGDMIEYRETRDYFQNAKRTIQANFLEVNEESSEDEDNESPQKHNRSTDSQGLHEWDYWCSEDEDLWNNSERKKLRN